MSEATGLRIGCVTDAAGMEALRPEWAALWRRADATPFVSPAWLIPWWRQFGGRGLTLVTARCGAALVGVLPLFLYEDAGRRRLLPLGIGISDCFDALSDPAQPHAAEAMLAGIGARCPVSDSLELHELPPDSPLIDCPAGTMTGRIEAQSACPVLVLPADPDALWATMPAGIRRKTLYYRRRLATLGPVRVLRADTGSLDRCVTALFRLHTAQWRSRGEAGMLSDERVRGFHREAASALLALDALHLYAIELAHEIVGVIYCLADGRRIHAYLSGIDPRFRQPGLGTLLVAHAIEEAAREGRREFHFLRGREPYKYRWGAVDRINRLRILTRSG